MAAMDNVEAPVRKKQLFAVAFILGTYLDEPAFL